MRNETAPDRSSISGLVEVPEPPDLEPNLTTKTRCWLSGCIFVSIQGQRAAVVLVGRVFSFSCRCASDTDDAQREIVTPSVRVGIGGWRLGKEEEKGSSYYSLA